VSAPGRSRAAQSGTCFGRSITIAGTPGADELFGVSGSVDVIDGRGGADLIYANTEDFVCGGAGDDEIHGDNFNLDAPSRTRMTGDGGADLLYASRYGGDVIYGGPGDDRLHGAASGYGPNAVAQYRTVLHGQQGDDHLSSSSYGNTYMNGGADHDTCWWRAYEQYAGPNEAVNCEAR
jgi:Ca2+-binding RTX toxin-like protein